MDQNPGVTPQKVIPLLLALSRIEDLVSLTAVRLDPITNHVPANDAGSGTLTSPSTVTGRINSLGDALQYLLDNIEL